MFKPFQKIIDLFRNHLKDEVELIKLRMLRVLSTLVGHGFALLFLIMFFNITLVLGGLWLGFFLSDVLGSFQAGFGAAALIFVVLMTLLFILHRPLLVKPFQSAIIRLYSMIEETEQREEKSRGHEK